jgi:hypothetical protein
MSMSMRTKVDVAAVAAVFVAALLGMRGSFALGQAASRQAASARGAASRPSSLAPGAVVAPAANAAPPATAAPASGTVVLDTNGMWRMHQTLRPPVLRTEGGLKPLLMKMPWIDRETDSPAADWMKPDFDDHRWMRGPSRLVAPTPYLARLCLRGKFTVTDAAKVQGLKLSVGYHGGVVVYVNGQELTRGNVAAASAGSGQTPSAGSRQVPSTGPGQAGAADVAEDYPAEAFLTTEGKLLLFEAARRNLPEGNPQLKIIRREIADVEIPAKMLRPGVNVVAIDVLRAPYPAVVDEKKDPKQTFWNFAWDNCQVDRVQLTAGGAEGLVPNAVRPAGLQVWNSNTLACDYDLDFGDAAEKVQAIEIVGARNGSFSGKAVVGSSRPIEGLKAVAGELKGPGPAPQGPAVGGGVIPAGQVETRFALPWGRDEINMYYGAYPYPAEATQLACLCAQAPEEIPLGKKKAGGKRPNDVEIVNGAVVPVWVTVHVPKDAKAGLYKGQVTIEAAGEKAVAVPVEINVADWTLPDVESRRTSVEVLQSPDTLAAEYKTPLWSEEHWDLIGQSFRLMSDSGSRILHIPLIAETNMGHEQTMVRWVKKAPGASTSSSAVGAAGSAAAGTQPAGEAYDYDFTILEKYLDMAEKNLGRPTILIFHVWDVYMIEKGRQAPPGSIDERWHAEREAAGQGAITGRGPMVTAWDPASGKAENVTLPHYREAGSEALWKPLWEQLQQRLAKRGLDKTVMLGLMTDVLPSKEEAAFWAKIAPNVPWAVHSHSYNGGTTLYNLAKVDYRLGVWGIQNATAKSLMGWAHPDLLNRYWRQGGFDFFPGATWRELSEFAITGDTRGTGRLGGDFWEVFRDKNGQRRNRIYTRYPQSMWRNLDVYVSLLAPGPKGPGATQHYVNLVEGVQECEARIVIEKALGDPAMKAKLGEDLSGRCQAALEERLRDMQLTFCSLFNRLDYAPGGIGSTGGPGTAGHYWFVASGWEARDAKLFALAGEVARKTGQQ